jgi:ligand-binding sensor domain-containing protein
MIACSSLNEQGWKSYDVDMAVIDLAFDHDGNLWLAGSDGIRKLNPQTGKQIKYSIDDGLANNYVLTVVLGSGNTLWFGTQEGLSNFDGNKWYTYQQGYTIPSLITTRDGLLWIGVRRELEGCHDCGWVLLFDGENWSNYSIFEGVEPNTIAEDQNGKLWFGTVRGLVSYDGEEWTHYQIPGNSQHNNIVDVLIASDGNVWVGSAQNVHRFDGKSWITYTQQNGLPCNRISALTEDSKGVIWIGTTCGIASYDGKTWSAYSTEDGLIDNWVNAVVIGPNDTIWFGTRNGISRLLIND